MAGIGRDGLMVTLVCSQVTSAVVLVIARDGGERQEVWPTLEGALKRAALLAVSWKSENEITEVSR